jgi:hypothetical protein
MNKKTVEPNHQKAVRKPKVFLAVHGQGHDTHLHTNQSGPPAQNRRNPHGQLKTANNSISG